MKIGSFAPYRLPKLDEKCIPGMISNCDLLFKLPLNKICFTKSHVLFERGVIYPIENQYVCFIP